MKAIDIWEVWISEDGDEEMYWRLFDLCLSFESAKRVEKEGKNIYPEADFCIEKSVAHG